MANEDDLAWARPRLVDQLLRTFEQPIWCAGAAAERFPRTYHDCTEFGTTFTRFAAVAQHDPARRYQQLVAGHDALITMPQAVVDLLLEVAGGGIR